MPSLVGHMGTSFLLYKGIVNSHPLTCLWHSNNMTGITGKSIHVLIILPPKSCFSSPYRFKDGISGHLHTEQ